MPTINDATVVASAYDTSGNGGRRLIRLKSGTLVAAVVSTYRILLYKSTNNGTTWVNFAENTGTSTGTTYSNISLATDGTRIFLLGGKTNNYYLDFRITDEAGNGFTTSYAPDVVQTALGNVSLAINEAGTGGWGAWASKNSTYPNSFNIRSAPFTINANGSVTWGAVEQLTSSNTAGLNNQNPSITVDKNGSPVILYERNGTGNFGIRKLIKNPSWIDALIYDGAGYAQSSPSAIFVPQSVNGLANGRIWIAWHGMDATDTTQYNIRISYSDDGGVTWSAMQKITTGNNSWWHCWYPTLTANKRNELFVLYNVGGSSSNQYDIGMNAYSSGAWGAKTTVKDTTDPNMRNPSALYDPNLDFTSPLFIYRDTAKVGFYGTWTVTTISVTQGNIGNKSDKTNLLTYTITTDGTMSVITEKVNGVTIGTKTATSGQSLIAGLTQAQWDAVRFGKYNTGGKNLIPSFSKWGKHSNAKTINEDELELVATSGYQDTTIVVDVLPFTDYTFSMSHNGSTGIFGASGSPALQTFTSNNVVTFNTGDVTKIRVYATNSTAGTFNFTNPQLEIGTIATSFEPYEAMKNTLTVEMGAEKWTYTFDKRLATDADILSAVKATQDVQTTYLPAVKSKLASAVRGKGGTVNDGDSWDAMVGAVGGIPLGKKWASGTIRPDGGGTFVITGLNFKPKHVSIFYNTSYYAFGFTTSTGVDVGTKMYNSSLSSATFTPNNTGFVLVFTTYNVDFTWIASE